MIQRAGFTLVEVMISMAILLIALLGANMQYLSQLRLEGASNIQAQVRTTVNQIISQITAHPGDFPALTDANEKPVIYAACFSENGTPQKNLKQNNTNGFWGRLSVQNPAELLPDFCSKNPPVSDDLPGIEIHVIRDIPNGAHVYGFLLPKSQIRLVTPNATGSNLPIQVLSLGEQVYIEPSL